MDTASSWKKIVEPVEPFLKDVAVQLAAQVQAFEPEIATYAQYALSNQGKQLRPVLVGLSAGAAGRLAPAHVTVAVIIEMVHLATLVHDDIMDEAEMRRNRPTLAATWGNDISVLLGDCLFAHALKLAAGYPTPEVCRAVASATNTVCTGEILQTLRRRDGQATQAGYFKILRMKTGELFALSCELGAFLAETSPAHRAALRDFGMAVGTAYQIFDDCMDIFGSEISAGKSLGTDLATGKLTLPMLLLLERLTPPEQARVRACVAQWKPRHFPEILDLLRQHRALADSQAEIFRLLGQAQALLDPLPPSQSREALRGLAAYLVVMTNALGRTT